MAVVFRVPLSLSTSKLKHGKPIHPYHSAATASRQDLRNISGWSICLSHNDCLDPWRRTAGAQATVSQVLPLSAALTAKVGIRGLLWWHSCLATRGVPTWSLSPWQFALGLVNVRVREQLVIWADAKVGTAVATALPVWGELSLWLSKHLLVAQYGARKHQHGESEMFWTRGQAFQVRVFFTESLWFVCRRPLLRVLRTP